MTAAPWSWPASTITRVVDGDSIVARVTRDIGFHGTVTFDQHLRLNRINASPASTDLGKQATAFVTAKTTFPCDIITTRAYKFGDEWMAEVTLSDGENLSDALVAAGLAFYWDGTGPRPGG
jgi:endonuclease YncB( thermonuclease family)